MQSFCLFVLYSVWTCHEGVNEQSMQNWYQGIGFMFQDVLVVIAGSISLNQYLQKNAESSVIWL